MSKIVIVIAAFLSVFMTEALARDEIAGPVEAEILRIIDGDTLLVEARPWPQQRMEVYVRIRGIDAPEMKSKCPRIREAGSEARKALEGLMASSERVQLIHISGDKYFGRIVADVMLPDGRSAADSMQRMGLVRAYDGGRKPTEVCNS